MRGTLLGVITVLACTPGVRAQAGNTDTLTLDQALSLALAGNRAIAAAKLDVEKADRDLTVLKTQRLPLFGVRLLEGGLLSPFAFEFATGVLGTYAATGPIPSQNTTIDSPRSFNSAALITASQPLTQLRRIGIGAELLDLGRLVAEEKLREQRQSTVADVKRLYYSALQAQSGIRAVEDAIALFQELDRVTTDYVERQVVLPADSLSVKAELARAEQQLLVLQDTVATMKEQLNLLIGRDLDAPVRLSGIPDVLPFEVSLAAAQASAREQRPALREAGLDVKRAETNLRLKRAEAIPDVSLTFGYLRLFNFEVLPRNIAALGVTLNWEPFDWGRRKLETGSRERTLQQATLAQTEAGARVRADINARFRKITESRLLLNVTDLVRQAAREKLRVATDRYQIDAALVKDVLAAQAALAEATQKHEEALLDFWTARAEFEHALGES